MAYDDPDEELYSLDGLTVDQILERIAEIEEWYPLNSVSIRAREEQLKEHRAKLKSLRRNK